MPSSDLIQSVRAQATLRLKFGLFVLAVMLGAMAYWGPARPDIGKSASSASPTSVTT